MAYYGCAAEEAAALDLTQPINIGLCHITIAHPDAFEYASAAVSSTPIYDIAGYRLESYDTVFSAAGRDASDSRQSQGCRGLPWHASDSRQRSKGWDGLL